MTSSTSAALGVRPDYVRGLYRRPTEGSTPTTSRRRSDGDRWRVHSRHGSRRLWPAVDGRSAAMKAVGLTPKDVARYRRSNRGLPSVDTLVGAKAAGLDPGGHRPRRSRITFAGLPGRRSNDPTDAVLTPCFGRTGKPCLRFRGECDDTYVRLLRRDAGFCGRDFVRLHGGCVRRDPLPPRCNAVQQGSMRVSGGRNRTTHWSTDFNTGELQGLDVARCAQAGGPVRFALVREAGRLDCVGSGGRSTASGDCNFTSTRASVISSSAGA